MPLFDRLALSDERDLATVFASAPPPRFDAIAGWTWRGYNIDPITRFLGIRKFMKAFFTTEHGAEGCNLRVFQSALAAPWVPRTRHGKPDAFAFYLVSDQDEPRRLEANPRALVIDYAASPRNPVYHVERVIRDYLVQPEAGDPDVLLGRAYLGIGRMRLASSFFVIARAGPFTWPV